MAKFTKATEVVRDRHNEAKVHVFIRHTDGRIDYRQVQDHTKCVPDTATEEFLQKHGHLYQAYTLNAFCPNIGPDMGYAHLCSLQGRKLNTLTATKKILAKGMADDKARTEKTMFDGWLLFSRGVEVSSIDSHGERGEYYDTLPQSKLTQAILNGAANDGHGCGRVNLYGGTDAADSPLAYREGDYEPMYSDGYDLEIIPAGAPAKVYQRK